MEEDVSCFPWLFPAFPSCFPLSPDVSCFPRMFPTFPGCFPLSLVVSRFPWMFPALPDCFLLSLVVSYFPECFLISHCGGLFVGKLPLTSHFKKHWIEHFSLTQNSPIDPSHYHKATWWIIMELKDLGNSENTTALNI